MKNAGKLKEKAEMAKQAKGMGFKRCTCIVYSTSDEDFDDLDEFVDFEFMDFCIACRRFTKYKIFPKRNQ